VRITTLTSGKYIIQVANRNGSVAISNKLLAKWSLVWSWKLELEFFSIIDAPLFVYYLYDASMRCCSIFTTSLHLLAWIHNACIFRFHSASAPTFLIWCFHYMCEILNASLPCLQRTMAKTLGLCILCFQSASDPRQEQWASYNAAVISYYDVFVVVHFTSLST